MRRQLVRIVGLALCASALAGCSMIDGDTPSSVPPSARGADALPANMDLASGVRQAQLLRVNGDLVGATRIISQLMLAAPDDSRVVGEYGKLLVQQNQTTDAIQFLRRAIELQPNDWTLYSALGVAYDQANDRPNAKLAYERGLNMKPGEPALLNNYAMSRLLGGDPIAARTLFLQAQASGSSDPRIAKNLAMLDTMAPAAPIAPAAPVAAPPRAVAAALPPAHTAPHPLATNTGFPPVTVPPKPVATASTLPLPVTRGNTQVVMQEVPVDPLAGPVGRNPHPPKPSAKPSKLATHTAPHHVAAAAPAKPSEKPVKIAKADKPAKPAKPAKDHIPALRMTADASKP